MGIQLKTSSEPIELSDTVALSMLDRSKQIMTTMVGYKELMMRYTCAMKEIQTKFEVLNTEYNVRFQHSPIVSISSRLKRTASIADKLERLGVDFSVENIARYLYDVAGVRVICSYVDDIYTLAKALVGQDDVSLIREKDYIQTPKKNGYRSLHLIVGVPVFFSDVKRIMPVEVQIRTVAMDYWAGLEHQLKYKQKVPDEETIVYELKRCADELADIDNRMLALRERIEHLSPLPTEEEILNEKLRNLDFPIG